MNSIPSGMRRKGPPAIGKGGSKPLDREAEIKAWRPAIERARRKLCEPNPFYLMLKRDMERKRGRR